MQVYIGGSETKSGTPGENFLKGWTTLRNIHNKTIVSSFIPRKSNVLKV